MNRSELAQQSKTLEAKAAKWTAEVRAAVEKLNEAAEEMGPYEITIELADLPDEERMDFIASAGSGFIFLGGLIAGMIHEAKEAEPAGAFTLVLEGLEGVTP